jgi:hypothetical protein
MTQSVLRDQGLKLQVVPSLIMGNRESCGTGSFVRWMRRQLLTSRLYHPGWWLVVLHCLSTTAAPLACGVSMIWAAAAGDLPAAAWFAVALLIYESCAAAMLYVIGSAVRAAAGQRSSLWSWFRLGQLPRFVLGLLATQAAYGYALFGAFGGRKFEWRGIEYDVRGAWKVRMKEFKPFRPSDAPPGAEQSL